MVVFKYLVEEQGAGHSLESTMEQRYLGVAKMFLLKLGEPVFIINVRGLDNGAGARHDGGQGPKSQRL